MVAGDLAGLFTQKDRGKGETGQPHAEGDERDGAEAWRGDAHEQERGTPDRC